LGRPFSPNQTTPAAVPPLRFLLSQILTASPEVLASHPRCCSGRVPSLLSFLPYLSTFLGFFPPFFLLPLSPPFGSPLHTTYYGFSPLLFFSDRLCKPFYTFFFLPLSFPFFSYSFFVFAGVDASTPFSPIFTFLFLNFWWRTSPDLNSGWDSGFFTPRPGFFLAFWAD